MHGYDPATYGDRFADVYDDWYPEADTTPATIAALLALTQPGDRVLELGVGTGRLAIPLAAAGRRVWGLDASAAMIEALRAKPGGEAIRTIVADMGGPLPEGPFALVVVALNTFFSLPSADEQRAAVGRIADVLSPEGSFVVAAFVPAPAPDAELATGDSVVDRVEVRTMSAERVVLSVSRSDPRTQRAEGQYIEFTDGFAVRLRPWSIRYSSPGELDDFARAAGLVLESRHGDWAGTQFDDTSSHHVSRYRHRR